MRAVVPEELLEQRRRLGLDRRDDDYRVPDPLFFLPGDESARGAEGAELVVEILSPNDETHQKLSWYDALGVRLTWDGGETTL